VSVEGLLCLAAGAACFGVGIAALLALRGRLELVARAEHELRGPATALALACERMRRDSAATPHAEVIEAQLERMRAGLDDLAAARRGGRASRSLSSLVDVASFIRAAVEPWRAQLRRCSLELPSNAAVAVTDRGRLAQALGNLLANSAEHGAGDLRLRAHRVEGAVRLEVRNVNPARPQKGPSAGEAARNGSDGGRGRGLAIARQAARDLGGRLLVHTEGPATVAVLELPDGTADAELEGRRPPSDRAPVNGARRPAADRGAEGVRRPPAEGKAPHAVGLPATNREGEARLRQPPARDPAEPDAVA
jgi:signal transduction histidine kinase